MRVPTAKVKKLQNIDNIFEQPREKSNRNGIGDTRINDGDWVSHDATALRVAKAVNKSPHRPFHHRRYYERQKPECGSHHLAPARIACTPTLYTHRHPHTNN
ncbi:unnamed protein product [Camellia sinensis]